MITFKPKVVTKKMLSVLPERARDVLEKRYGLGPTSETHTLESIGKTYGITRERVRQIENYGVQTIQKSDVYAEFTDAFSELQNAFHSLGGVISEQDLFNELSKDASLRNHLYFILVVGDPFKRVKEDNSFNYRWYIEKKISDTVESALKNIFESLEEDDLVSEDEIVARLKNELGEIEE